MFNKQNKTSLSEYWNSYRNVLLQPWPLRYSLLYSDNDVLLDNSTRENAIASEIIFYMRETNGNYCIAPNIHDIFLITSVGF